MPGGKDQGSVGESRVRAPRLLVSGSLSQIMAGGFCTGGEVVVDLTDRVVGTADVNEGDTREGSATLSASRLLGFAFVKGRHGIGKVEEHAAGSQSLAER